MPKATKLPHGRPDAENPEWTRDRFARSKSLDQLPTAMQKALGAGRQRARRPAAKVSTTIRLSADVVDALQATGR